MEVTRLLTRVRRVRGIELLYTKWGKNIRCAHNKLHFTTYVLLWRSLPRGVFHNQVEVYVIQYLSNLFIGDQLDRPVEPVYGIASVRKLLHPTFRIQL